MSGGIQSLLKTEKDAQEIVSEARKYRTQKLKAAKLDAKADVDSYKAKKAKQLTKFEDEFVGTNKKAEQDADKQVEGDLEGIKKAVAEKREAVVKLLVDAIGTPNPEMPRNITKIH
ncbi:hypothetical protein FOA43_004452 [Brettanomyces nanus]|uniref:V-type proton ATPase subunit G n=1 Tax=Eeniella nana TaxID=13502 RepID=A0A875SEH7_EENNA|nr:uncharacterized protein FOA43_004452 [Brettanomyces nanus]QPG77054.1 hypothetical protein FOA43_004452 [Brettanomyces nanus]